jgi:hypothetical protein
MISDYTHYTHAGEVAAPARDQTVPTLEKGGDNFEAWKKYSSLKH